MASSSSSCWSSSFSRSPSSGSATCGGHLLPGLEVGLARSVLRCFRFLPSETLKLVFPFFFFLGCFVRGDSFRGLFASSWFVFALFLVCWALSPCESVCVCAESQIYPGTTFQSCRGCKQLIRSCTNEDTGCVMVISLGRSVTYLQKRHIVWCVAPLLYKDQRLQFSCVAFDVPFSSQLEVM